MHSRAGYGKDSVCTWLLARSVSLDHNQQTSKNVKLTTQIAQIHPRISRAIFEDISFQKFSKWKGKVVLLNQFSKLKRSLFEKRSIFYLLRVGFLKQCKFQKISFENRHHTNKGRFYCIFKFKGILILTLVYLLLFSLKLQVRYSFSKSRA